MDGMHSEDPSVDEVTNASSQPVASAAMEIDTEPAQQPIMSSSVPDESVAMNVSSGPEEDAATEPSSTSSTSSSSSSTVVHAQPAPVASPGEAEDSSFDFAKAIEEKQVSVRAELAKLLESKGLDPEYLAGFGVNVSRNKKKGVNQVSFQVTYTGPDGAIMGCRGDIVQAVRSIVKAKALGLLSPAAVASHGLGSASVFGSQAHDPTNATAQRLAAHEAQRARNIAFALASSSSAASSSEGEAEAEGEAKEEGEGKGEKEGEGGEEGKGEGEEGSMEQAPGPGSEPAPCEIGGVRVVKWGTINTSSAFHNAVNIFPVGYTCELEMARTSTKPPQVWRCTVNNNKNRAEFCMLNRNSGVFLFGPTEADVRRQFELSEGIVGLADSSASTFFPLEVELVIEGMDGALECQGYKFHVERGYPAAYQTQEQAYASKSAFLVKWERERRRGARTNNPADAVTSTLRQRQASENLRTKENLLLERQRKEREKQEERERKEKAREDAKRSKEEEKRLEQEGRDRKREEDRLHKERQKLGEKYRGTYRRSVRGEVNKTRSTLRMKVLQFFDAEEQQAELETQANEGAQGGPTSAPKSTKSSASDANANLTVDEIIARSRTVEEHYRLATTSDVEASFDDIVSLTSVLRTYKSVLGIEMNFTLDHIIYVLQTVSAVPGSPTASSGDSMVVDGADAGGAFVSAAERLKCEGEMDRIQLCLTKTLLTMLHGALDLDASDAGGNRLPLNQLTWPEIAKQSLVSYVINELSHRPKEEVQHILRGSRGSSSYRNFKSVSRLIRYRWETRLKYDAKATSKSKDDVLALSANSTRFGSAGQQAFLDKLQLLSNNIPIPLVPYASLPKTDYSDMFSTEQEIINALNAASANTADYTETYRRCMKVLLKLLSLSQSRTFIWLIEKSVSEYHNVIKMPVSFATIAANLIQKAYSSSSNGNSSSSSGSSGSSSDDISVAYAFHADTNLLAANCYTFNIETAPFNSQVQKCQQAAHRHVQAWVLSPTRPPIEQCNEFTCLLTCTVIYAYQGMRCGRCLALYSLNGLSEASRVNPTVVFPSQDLINATAHEEWFCPFCLAEDSVTLGGDNGSGSSTGGPYGSPFSFDEMGPSSSIPWQLNASLSRDAERLVYNKPHLRNVVDALKVLAREDKTPLMMQAPIQRGQRPGEAATTQTVGSKPWTVAERVKVLLALSDILLSFQTTHGKFLEISFNCGKLRSICSQEGTFREHDFLRTVKVVAGDEGVTLCKQLLDGMGDVDASELAQQREREAQVFEGRCMICKESTFDEEAETAPDEVILCDGCNSESHLRCLHLSSVPTDDFYCAVCVERRMEKEDKAAELGDALKSHRSKYMEEEIENHIIDIRAAADGVKIAGSLEELSSGRCAYCDGTELDGCSPFVIGQTRQEFEFYCGTCQPIVFERPALGMKAGAAVNFYVDGDYVEPPVLDVPYFPLLTSPNGEEMLAYYKDRGMEDSAIIVHEICALEMYKARINRSVHDMRRRRNLVAERAVKMSGISVRPLGMDSQGREYWKFPSSPHLFICQGANCNGEVDFKAHATTDRSALAALSAGMPRSKHVWRVITDPSEALLLADTMGGKSSTPLSSAELLLKKALKETFMDVKILVAAMASANANSTTGGSSAESSSSSSSNEAKAAMDIADDNSNTAHNASIDSTAPAVPAQPTALDPASHTNTTHPNTTFHDPDTPVSIQLEVKKGHDVSRYQYINTEPIFDENPITTEHEEEQSEAPHLEYLSFTKKFYGISLVNSAGKRVRLQKGAVTVCYQIHREGSLHPIALTRLSEPWGDGLFYFTTAQFRRSGNYTISFVVEGLNAAVIRPLVYPVTVTSRGRRCGAGDALERLTASGYLLTLGRRAHATGRKLQLDKRLSNTQTDIDSVKSALLTLFCALPNGCLTLSDHDDEALAESTGWSDSLETHWCSAVEEATTAVELMECVLLLENHLAKTWYIPNRNAMLISMPSPHYALRACTLAAVAFRIYTIDRVVDFSKVADEKRKNRKSGGGGGGGGGTRASRVDRSEVVEERTIGRKRGDDSDLHAAHADSTTATTGTTSKRSRPSYAAYADDAPDYDD